MNRKITIKKAERLYSLLMKKYTDDPDFEYHATGEELEKLKKLIEQKIIDYRVPYETQLNKLIRYFIAHFHLFYHLSATIWPDKYKVDIENILDNEVFEFWGYQALDSWQNLDEEYESFFINNLGLHSKELIKYIEKDNYAAISIN